MENENIVMVGQQPWDTDIGSNCKSLAVELSKKNTVLYVNSPLDRITSLRHSDDEKVKRRKNVIRKLSPALIQLDRSLWNLYPDRLVESINWIRNGYIFDALNKRNNKLLAGSIRSALDKLGLTDFILFNDNEMFKGFYLKELLKPRLSIYYSRDYMLGVDYWRRHGERLEPRLIEKSDWCFANSMYLAEYCATYNPNSGYIGQGCDIGVVDKAKLSEWKSEELTEGKGPVIGYVGSLDSNRLDIGLIAHIARGLSHYRVVLVGPEDPVFQSSELHTIENIVFLGKKPVNDLPYYINTFDICINPQLVNPITIGNYPRKIDEYLALGKPTVATYTVTMEAFRDVVYLANTKDDFVKLILEAKDKDNESLQLNRQQVAASHTWEQCVREMNRHINALTSLNAGQC